MPHLSHVAVLAGAGKGHNACGQEAGGREEGSEEAVGEWRPACEEEGKEGGVTLQTCIASALAMTTRADCAVTGACIIMCVLV